MQVAGFATGRCFSDCGDSGGLSPVFNFGDFGNRGPRQARFWLVGVEFRRFWQSLSDQCYPRSSAVKFAFSISAIFGTFGASGNLSHQR
jgi:hypothetical protein